VEVDAGRAVYRDALEATDMLWTADEHRAELFLSLRNEAAPTSFHWRVALGAGLVKGVAEARGGVAFLDTTGRKRLRVGAAHAVDANGIRREATLGWSEGLLRLDLDARGLAFPLAASPIR
jgi:hypothetical protein